MLRPTSSVAFRPRSRWRSVLGPASTALLVLSAAAAALVAVGLGTGWWRMLPVLSPSMRPTFDAGAVVVAVRAPSSSVRIGDVLVYEAPVEDRHVVAHRVVRVVEAGPHPVVQTRGDANDAPDPWLARLQDDTVWKVRADLPAAGHALVYLRRPRVRYALLLVVVGFALAASLREVWGGGRRRAGRPAGAGNTRAAGRHRPAHPAGVGDLAVVAERRAPDGLRRDAGAADGDGSLRSATFTDSTATSLTTYYFVVQSTRHLWRSVDSTQASAAVPLWLCTG